MLVKICKYSIRSLYNDMLMKMCHLFNLTVSKSLISINTLQIAGITTVYTEFYSWDVGNWGHREEVPPLFTNFYVKCPFLAYSQMPNKRGVVIINRGLEKILNGFKLL